MSEVHTAPPVRSLMFAWLADPERGSEWAAAWGMAVAAARLGPVRLLVRPDCEAPIRSWCARHPEVPIEPLAVAPAERWYPRFAPALPKGHFLDYFAWLEAAGAVARRLVARERFDLAVHAALGCYWLPSPVVDLGIPSVWGPVGGATRPPRALLSALGARGLVERACERAILAVAARLPATRRTMRRADLVLVEGRATRAALPADVAARARMFNRAVLVRVPRVPERPRGRTVLFPSTLDGRKAPRLALEAFRFAPEDAILLFANEGPEEAFLRRRAEALGLGGRVRFLGRVPRMRCFELVREAGAVIFTGLNEDGGCALCEAMVLGAPVVVLAHSGPREIVETWGTDPARVALVPPAGPRATAERLGEALRRFLERPPRAASPYLDQDGAIRSFTELLAQAARGRAAADPARAPARSEPAPETLAPSLRV
ncbi:MAG: glycosyltransferase [Geminicoccaceae bacterium]|nr:glycosyltransferase [Geminicoccaceae bacterium]MDW8123767.1 glycosyltransferase [Geminicoccaceae bacterium]